MNQQRLTGTHIVVIVLAVCAALVLAPVGVYAAAKQKVSIADWKTPTRTAKVDRTGRLLTTTAGRVSVAGTVGVAPPASPFHRDQHVPGVSETQLGAAIPKGRSLAISSISAVATSGGAGWSQILVRRATPAGTCSSSGTQVAVVANFKLNDANTNTAAPANFTQTFPVPQVHRGGSSALCLRVLAAPDLAVVLDGFVY